MNAVPVPTKPAHDIHAPVRPVAGQVRRPGRRPYVEAAALVAVWATLGLGPVRDPVAYLLAGIPLTAVFQLAVRRRPLRELWIRDGQFRRPPRTKWAITSAALGAVPAWTAWHAATQQQWMPLAWAAAACCGAVIGSAVILQRRDPCAGRRRPTWTHGLGAAIGAVVTGAAVVGVSLLGTLEDRSWTLSDALAAFVHSTLLYLPALFVLEEVTFRGCLDAHLYPPSPGPGREPAKRGMASILLGSWLWGLWHVPLFAGGSTPWYVLIPYLLTVHTIIGVPLVVAWRRSGSLVLPAAAHAVIDGLRNAVLAT